MDRNELIAGWDTNKLYQVDRLVETNRESVAFWNNFSNDEIRKMIENLYQAFNFHINGRSKDEFKIFIDGFNTKDARFVVETIMDYMKRQEYNVVAVSTTQENKVAVLNFNNFTNAWKRLREYFPKVFDLYCSDSRVIYSTAFCAIVFDILQGEFDDPDCYESEVMWQYQDQFKPGSSEWNDALKRCKSAGFDIDQIYDAL